MNWTLFSPLAGTLHTLACLVALPTGAWLMVARKGTARHRFWGDVFTGAMLVGGALSLTIYSQGHLHRPHYLAMTSMVLSAAGFALARWKTPPGAWRYLHIVCMVGAYYVLVGGLLQEMLLRVGALRRLVAAQPALAPQAHGGLMMGFLGLILIYLAATGVGQARIALRARRRAT
ncbi:hypothetical protein [Phenylobacterium sp.]|jgi:uncharacterized membrane protein|uniref:hypothetical protein n=1 Tax=Phenylobacterium sp. TaxID=1871053 RepID=UPI002F920F3A